MRNINYFDKELSVEEYVKKEVCKNAGTQSVAFKEQLISLCSSAGIECNEKMKKEELEKIISQIIEETGASSMKDMGKVMKLAKEKCGVSADGRDINEIAKKYLTKVN